MKHSSLGNTFFRDDVSSFALKRENYSATSARLDKQMLVTLNESFALVLVCDSLFKKVASHESGLFLMRAWLAGIILAIFGLWLATI